MSITLSNEKSRTLPISRFIKVVLDRFTAALLLLLLAPILLLISITIYRHMGRPILFTQARPGLRGRIFKLYKFRTMTRERDARGNLLPEHQRIPPLGQFLRQSSLDELPQLWNVLRGDMSFIGPRPLLVAYLDRYSPEQARRHDVKPGITGWAQINGRNAISWQEKFLLDVWYVDHWSLWLDAQILLKTVEKVWKRDGINQDDQVSMEEFTGTN